LLAAIVLCTAVDAEAADPAKAKALIAQARAAAKAGKLEDAIAKLKQAQQHLDHPAILFAQARVYTRMLRLDMAAAALDKAESDFELPRKLKGAVDKQRGVIKGLMQKYGQLRVTVKPATAVVTIDGTKHEGGFDKWVEPGKRRIEIAAAGYAPAVRPATVELGKLAEVKVVLRELTGTLKIVVPGGLKGVQVMIDGKEAEIGDAERAGDIARVEVPGGAHEVVCVRGKKRDSKVLKVVINEATQVRCEGVALGVGGGRQAMGWGAVAVGALLAGLGTYHINGYFADVAQTEVGGKWQGHIASMDRAYGGTAFLVSGVAIGVTSYLLLLREPGSGDTAALSLQPQAPSPLFARSPR